MFIHVHIIVYPVYSWSVGRLTFSVPGAMGLPKVRGEHGKKTSIVRVVFTNIQLRI